MRKRVVSRRLKGLLVEHDMSIKDLAKRIGISENSLTLKINGHRDWWYWELMLIVKVFGFSEVKEVFPELYEAVSKVS
ncbi:MAG TPA: helix-turn-helix transcriptional regulator [Bacillota bacterium]|nr:helix-turn-helix transcriptional regulator [Bacillota bacterium]